MIKTIFTIILLISSFSTQAIDVRNYGYNETALSSAISALPSAGGTIFFHSGNYTLNSATFIVNKSNITFEGEAGATITSTNASGTSWQMNGNSGVTFKNLSFTM